MALPHKRKAARASPQKARTGRFNVSNGLGFRFIWSLP
jgi:hypothetical protein